MTRLYVASRRTESFPQRGWTTRSAMAQTATSRSARFGTPKSSSRRSGRAFSRSSPIWGSTQVSRKCLRYTTSLLAVAAASAVAPACKESLSDSSVVWAKQASPAPRAGLSSFVRTRRLGGSSADARSHGQATARVCPRKLDRDRLSVRDRSQSGSILKSYLSEAKGRLPEGSGLKESVPVADLCCDGSST